MEIDVEKHEGLIRDVINHSFGGIANAHKLAKTRGMDVEDLFQIGYMAMCIAANRYDAAKGKWSTFAYHYIKGHIFKELNKAFPLKMPTNMTLEEKIKNSKVESLYKKKCEDDSEGVYLIDSIPSPEEPFTDDLLVKQDLEAMADRLLTEHEKEVFLIWLNKDLTHKQIALQMGCTRMNITTLINKAKSKLSKEVS